MEDKPLIVGGKSYISSKRAATEFGYTNDYVGQLSRSNKISSMMVGRDRFIDYSSIATYADRAKQVRSVEIPKPPVVEKAEKVGAPGLDPRHLFVGGAMLVGLLLFFTVTPLGRSGAQNMISLLPQEFAVSTSIDEQASAISSLGQKSDAIYLGFLSGIDKSLVSLWSALRDKVLAILAPFFGDTTSETKVVVKGVTTIKELPSTTSGLSVEDVRTIATEVANQEIAKTIDYSSRPAGLNTGVVTIPSSGNSQSDAAITQTVKDSFSDQVNVTLDASRSSGIITPVFKNPTDDRYLFVVVPVSQTP
ncbi:MAG TPA: hypothetical protein VI953_00415 [Candidatus Paceibacterota bacterium]